MIDGDEVVRELVLPAPAEQVFDMFTDPRQLVRWIGVSADLQPRLSGSPPCTSNTGERTAHEAETWPLTS